MAGLLAYVVCDRLGNRLALVVLATGDEVHEWRNEFKADVVVLITSTSAARTCVLANPTTPNACSSGLADGMDHDNFRNSFEAYAFAVGDVGGFLTSEDTFAHELGHVMGAQHNLPSIGGAFPDSSHGHVDQTPEGNCERWMTIMAQRSTCRVCDSETGTSCVECERIAYWSIPDRAITHCVERVGKGIENNRDTLNFTAAAVASFRCGPAAPE